MLLEFKTQSYIIFHSKRHPATLGAPEAQAFLSHLAQVGHVSASTQNQALAAILFLYRHILAQPLPWLEQIEKAKRPARVPTVFTEAEVQRLFCEYIFDLPKTQIMLLNCLWRRAS